MVCLDTDLLVAYLRKDAAAMRKLQELDSKQEHLYTTMINAFELYKGAFRSKDASNEVARVDKLIDALFMLTPDRNVARTAGAISNEIKSNPVGESDLLIASIALANNQALLTRNLREFESILHLTIESW